VNEKFEASRRKCMLKFVSRGRLVMDMYNLGEKDGLTQSSAYKWHSSRLDKRFDTLDNPSGCAAQMAC